MSLSSLHIPSSQQAIANDKCTFIFNGVRIILLTDRMVRVEISPNNQFEDRPTQQFWYRNQPLPKVEISDSETDLLVTTEIFRIEYQKKTKGFSPENLIITIKESNKTIHLDDQNPGILPGTTRTLDNVNGSIKLEPGILSRDGWMQIEDTASLLFNDSGWLEERPKQKGYRDLYFLISGTEYQAALQAYQQISGTPPLLPRAFLGNWWSRFWAYTQQDIVDLVTEFKQRNFPFSVFIIDMDWHITQTGNQCSGWTGFSWNHDLIPQPEQMIQWLHDQNLITSMNLHPAEGIHPHEHQYGAAAKAMSLPPETEEPIPFTITDPNFTKVYFEKMLYPLENQGVDFWWLDWQQGEKTALKGLDPLWWLNHLHFYDQGKTIEKRPVIFSRWGGAGNQRYPVGFSGDTIITWQSLAFQPYFTATAANTAYGWWSHDIGGHMHGIDDGELYARWLQYGALSPILRIHCTNDKWMDHRPWTYGAEIERIVRNAMQFRHALVPYLYSMSRKNETEGLLPINPLYYEWPNDEESYQAENQYLFGSQLMAAPVVTPRIPQLDQSRQPIWFPDGNWFDFFTGELVSGNQWQVRLYKLDEIPLFARAGAIVPLNHDVLSNGCANPQSIDVHIFPSANGRFDLYEDDGFSQRYKTDGGCITIMQTRWQENKQTFSIFPADGNTSAIPQQRTYQLHFKGIRHTDRITILLDDVQIPAQTAYDENTHTLSVSGIEMSPAQKLTVTITTGEDSLLASPQSQETRMEQFLHRLPMKPDQKREIMNLFPQLTKDIQQINEITSGIHKLQKIALIEILTGVAAAPLTSPTGKKQIVLCNPQRKDGFQVKNESNVAIPAQGVLVDKQKTPYQINYFDLSKFKF